jgi:DNA-binding NtrC family response regulator
LLHFADLPSGVANFTRARMTAGLFTSVATGVGKGSIATPAPPQRSVVPLQELEKQAIQHALEHTRGDRTTAAQLLGIGRTTLYRKLKEYELD